MASVGTFLLAKRVPSTERTWHTLPKTLFLNIRLEKKNDRLRSSENNVFKSNLFQPYAFTMLNLITALWRQRNNVSNVCVYLNMIDFKASVDRIFSKVLPHRIERFIRMSKTSFYYYYYLIFFLQIKVMVTYCVCFFLISHHTVIYDLRLLWFYKDVVSINTVIPPAWVLQV